MKTTANEVVRSLNKLMQSHGSIVRFVVRDDAYSSMPTIDIGINDINIHSYILNMTSEFFDKIETHLWDNFRIDNIHYNNTRSCFWNRDIWNKREEDCEHEKTSEYNKGANKICEDCGREW